jgi:hypothetical protein
VAPRSRQSSAASARSPRCIWLFISAPCSVENLRGCQEHEVRRQHPQVDLFLLVGPRAGPQRRAQEPLRPREPALDRPPRAIDPARPGPARLATEPPHPRPPLLRPRPLPTGVAPSQREDRRADPPSLTGSGGVGRGVERGVAPERVPRAGDAGGTDRRRTLRRSLTRAATDVRREDQVTLGPSSTVEP